MNLPKVMSLKPYPSVGTSLEIYDYLMRSNNDGGENNGAAMIEEAWERLKKSYVYFKGKPLGTFASMNPMAEALNYNQVFVRDFVPTGLACLMRDLTEPKIVKNFLLKTLHLQGWEKMIDNFTLGEGVMPASFKVLFNSHKQKETLIVDFGGSAIGRVAPVDSGFWWIILLRSYTNYTLDYTLAERSEEIVNYMKTKKIKYLHDLHGWLGGGDDCEDGCGGGGGDKKVRGLLGDRGAIDACGAEPGEGTKALAVASNSLASVNLHLSREDTTRNGFNLIYISHFRHNHTTFAHLRSIL
ncbi:hypothetical protein Pint_20416 [Pistacia integerrima]|uniref:Uncharacterized protein n=1 Tax=Pistacia integerrima TaxID=434235 RepID=A0ACC0XDI3_9ROSI|nr:hypothetical protein Pint_20416 [Pistacia integerrima]